MDILDDPYVKWLQRQPDDEEIVKKIEKVLSTRRTYCNHIIRKVAKQSQELYQELGQWAGDYFVSSAKREFEGAMVDSYMIEDDLLLEERAFLADFFAQLPEPNLSPDTIVVSPKMDKLVSFLKEMDMPEFSGLVFAKQRSVVITMAKLLSIHPETRDRYRCAPYIGHSSFFNRKRRVGDMLTVHDQRDTLAEFRDGRKNLIISTDVLEEGIDINACSLVVCFDKPPNLKSFIQRRGRARRKESNYAIMFADSDNSVDVDHWGDLEKMMVEDYQKEERRLAELRDLEMIDEDVAGALSVESTGYVSLRRSPHVVPALC